MSEGHHGGKTERVALKNGGKVEKNWDIRRNRGRERRKGDCNENLICQIILLSFITVVSSPSLCLL